MILLFPPVIKSVFRQCRVLTMYEVQTWQLQRSWKPPDHRPVFEVLLLLYRTSVRKRDGSCLSQGFSYLRPDSRHAFETVSWCLLTNAFSYAAHGSIKGRALVKGVEFILLNDTELVFYKGYVHRLASLIFSKHTTKHDELNLFLSVSTKSRYYGWGKRSKFFSIFEEMHPWFVKPTGE